MVSTASYTFWASAKAQVLLKLPVEELRIICFYMVHLCLWYVIKVVISWHSNTDGFPPIKALWGGGNPYKSLCGLVNHAVLWDIFFPGLDQDNKLTWNCQEHPKRKQNHPKTNKIWSDVILRENAVKLFDPNKIFSRVLPRIWKWE